jgi:acetophenone carboxylase
MKYYSTSALGQGNKEGLTMRRKITEYLELDVSEEQWYCAECNVKLGDARRNPKELCLIRERDLTEVYPPWFGYTADPDYCSLREFYCPHCGVMIDVTYTPPGYPVVNDIDVDLDALKKRKTTNRGD